MEVCKKIARKGSETEVCKEDLGLTKRCGTSQFTQKRRGKLKVLLEDTELGAKFFS